MTAQVRIGTPYGEGRLVTHRARSPLATLLLSHGAGNGIDTSDLQALAGELPRNGITVALFEQPWKVAGSPVASPPKTLDVGLTAAANWMRVRTPLVVGGRSAGARSAARTGRSLGAAGCLALSFPLHPPGKPERSRVEELREARLPTLVIQGERDPMGRPEEFPELRGLDLAVVPAADHGLKVGARAPLSQQDVLDIVVESTLEWVVREISG
ncbi:MAG TPA: alpha/beta family hydrolase [Nocardioides sp.]|uniref:alpha/beta hydrolase family protein n=1 Tax=Nocardioides sp. TaxID=35761 RepID=UPI002ED95D6C